MSTDPTPTAPVVDAPTLAKDASVKAVATSWAELWQAPTIVASVALIIAGVQYGRRPAPPYDLESAFAAVEQLLEESEFEAAATRMEETIAPHLAAAAKVDHGRFQALAGDVLYLSMEAEGAQAAADLDLVVDRYSKALADGFQLIPVHFERWVIAQVLREEFRGARSTLARLDEFLDDPKQADEAAHIKGRLLRRIIEATIESPELGLEEALQLVHEYRSASAVTPAGSAWAICRQAELRLGAGLAREAVENLQMDMRRIEPQIGGDPKPLGEAYSLLARGYYELGDLDYADRQARIAMELLDPKDPVCAECLVTLGRIFVSRAKYEEALDSFSHVIDGFPGARAFPAALLGRAEMNGVLGRHEESQGDFESLSVRMPPNGRGGVSPQRVASGLADRHDAALASHQPELALAYIELASRFFEPGSLPEPVLRRLASSHRTIAERFQSEGLVADPGSREQARRNFLMAAGYFVARAAALHTSPNNEDAWADSLWLAADSFDLAGEYAEAVGQFQEFLVNRTPENDRWAEATFRLALCHLAENEFAEAAGLLESVIGANPNSLAAAQSHVPLAACYLALGTPALAEQQLLRVVFGGEPVGPTATAFRDALVVLGTFYYNGGNYVRAIEELEKAARYCAEESRMNVIRFRLADSYRLIVRRDVDEADDVAPRRTQELEEMRRAHLGRAMSLFAIVAESYESVGAARLDAVEKEYVRSAHLYMADCAFDLEDFGRAIDLYDRAAQRYADHPSSLTALIQIVNSYARMGDRPRAVAAHHRVLLKLQQLPEGALDGPDSALDEAAWRQWLDAMPPGMGLTGASPDQS